MRVKRENRKTNEENNCQLKFTLNLLKLYSTYTSVICLVIVLSRVEHTNNNIRSVAVIVISTSKLNFVNLIRLFLSTFLTFMLQYSLQYRLTGIQNFVFFALENDNLKEN
jgi:hypothetical protein